MKEGSHKRPHFTCFYVCEMSRIGKSIEVESRLVIARSGEQEGWGVSAHGYWVSLWADENILELYSGDDRTTLCKHQKPLKCTLILW